MQHRFLGGSASHVKVGEIGYGLMGITTAGGAWLISLGLTWRAGGISDEQAFEAMKSAIDAGATFWNAGVFYGRGANGEPENIKLIARFFAKYPELADKVFLSVKGGLGLDWVPDGSPEFLRKDVEGVLKYLDGKKRLDMFECARVDPKTPIETSIKALADLVQEGKFDHIGLSEVSASSIRRAAQIHPISTVEIEYSLWSTEARTNGVLSTAKELGITIIAYSPLGRGILTGAWRKSGDVPRELRRFPRFSDENFEANLKFVHFLNEMAERKGVTPAQLAIQWVLSQGDYIIPIPGASAIDRVKENMGASEVTLTNEELAEMDRFIQDTEVKGARYDGHQATLLWG